MECLHPSDFLHDFSSSYVSYTKSKQNSILTYYTLGLPGWLCTCCCVLCTGAEGKEGQVLVGIPIESNWLGTLCPLLSLDQVRGGKKGGMDGSTEPNPTLSDHIACPEWWVRNRTFGNNEA